MRAASPHRIDRPRLAHGPRPLVHGLRPLALLAGLAVLAACAGTNTGQVEAADDAAPAESTTSSTTSRPAEQDCASMLPTVGKVAQLLMVMVDEPAAAADVLSAGLVGGMGFRGNQRSDIDEGIAEAIEGAPLAPIVAADEEGGTVQRLRFSAGRIPSAREAAQGTPREAAALMEEHARRMAELGLTMNFAPVADVGSGSDLGSRTYGDDPGVVADFVEAQVTANLDGGIVPVVKHWPGIGGGDADPHEQLTTLAPIEELRTRDLVPFDRAIAAGAPAIMIAHAAVPGLTAADEPATLSREAITGELRGRQAFEGVVISDSLGMGAVVQTVPQDEAAERAIAAGADIALLSGTDVVEAAHDRLVDAIDTGRIPAAQVEESVRRVLALKGIEGECFDLLSEYANRTRVAADAGDCDDPAPGDDATEADPAPGDATEQDPGGDATADGDETTTDGGSDACDEEGTTGGEEGTTGGEGDAEGGTGGASGDGTG